MDKQKLELLKSEIDSYTGNNIVIAFSGGVDSSLILKLACDSARLKGTTVYGVTIRSLFNSEEDVIISKKTAAETGAEHIVIYTDNFEELGIGNNPPDRCYICKKNIFSKLMEKAKELNAPVVLDGTNKEDLNLYRPGIRALKELGILSPLADAGLTKKDVREIADYYNISTSSRPSVPCFATRFPYNTAITTADIKKVEEGENYLKSLGLYNVRLRIHGNIARIEVDEEYFSTIISNRAEIISKLKSLGYDYVVLDLEGFRSGSMDISLRNQ